MPPIIDLTGQRYGRLTVLRPGRTANGRFAWVCSCACGTAETHPIGGEKLRSGHTRSCGCVYVETRTADTSHMLPAPDATSVCPRCGAKVAPRTKKQTYCSRKCLWGAGAQQRRDAGTAYRRPKKDGPRPCEVCGTEFRAHGLARYCSSTCRTVGRSRAKLTNRVGSVTTQAASLTAELERKRDE